MRYMYNVYMCTVLNISKFSSQMKIHHLKVKTLPGEQQ